FFVSSRRRHTRSTRDWSSDVCSSDLQSPECSWSSGVVSDPRSILGIAALSHSANLLKLFSSTHTATRSGDASGFSRQIAVRRFRSEERRVGKALKWCRAGEG